MDFEDWLTLASFREDFWVFGNVRILPTHKFDLLMGTSEVLLRHPQHRVF